VLQWFELVVALFVILAGSNLFTNGVEWIGEDLGLSEGMVGSVLAAIGTALPETILPLVAILAGHTGGDDVGIGAILGAPFMLATLAMVVVAGSAWLFAARGHRERAILADRRVMSQDLTFFLGMYSLALAAGLVHVRVLHYILAVALLLAYGFYVRRHLRAPQEEEIEREAVGQIQPLYFRRWTGRMTGHPPAGKPPLWLTIVQTAAGLGVIIGGAKLFVSGIEYLAPKLGIPALPFALLLAPVATELPETFNSVLWLRRQRDTLAVGNVTGAMVFQSAFPVAIGLVFTPWRLTGDALVAAVVALAAGAVLLAMVRLRGRLSAGPLLFQGVFYLGFVVYVLTRL